MCGDDNYLEYSLWARYLIHIITNMDGGFLNMVIIISILGEEIMVQQG